MLNLLVMKYEGNKPDINDYVEYIDNKTVRKWKLGEMSMVIGVRVPTVTGYNLLDDEILIQLQSCICNLDIKDPQSLYTTENEALEFIERENQARRTTKEPLFTSTVDSRGRLTIRSDVRDRKNINTGDKVDVFKIEKRHNKDL